MALPPGASSGAEPCQRQSFRVAIDIGHTPGRPGATSARGTGEYQFNRAMALDLYRTLGERGFESAFVINESGEEISLRARTAAAAQERADLFLSIHHDSVQPHYLEAWTYGGRQRQHSDRFRGYSLFVSEKNTDPGTSRRFAEMIGAELNERGLTASLHHAEPIPGESRELLDPDRGLYRFDDLIVLKTATMPAVLLETGIIVNRDEEETLRRASFRGVVAEAIADAVTRMCAEMAKDGGG